jgi:hypothetical protein
LTSALTIVPSTIDELVTELAGITFCVKVKRFQLVPLYNQVFPPDVKVSLFAGESGKSIAIFSIISYIYILNN